MKTLDILNRQPSEKFVPSDGSRLDIVEVFATVQGEGPMVGQPAVFVRTAGCDLACPQCDTDYTTGRITEPIGVVTSRIVTEMNHLSLKNRLVVITGGEPFRQVLGPFVVNLLNMGYRVQIETNGTLYDDSMKPTQYNPNLSIICSPKSQIRDSLKPHVTALKYVLRSGYVDRDDGLPTRVLGNTLAPGRPWNEFKDAGKKVYVQPCDEGDGNEERTRENLFVTVESSMRFGYILSLQLHKQIGLP